MIRHSDRDEKLDRFVCQQKRVTENAPESIEAPLNRLSRKECVAFQTRVEVREFCESDVARPGSLSYLIYHVQHVHAPEALHSPRV